MYNLPIKIHKIIFFCHAVFVARRLWTPEHHALMCSFPKILPQSCKHTFVYNVFVRLTIAVPLSGSKFFKPHNNASFYKMSFVKKWCVMVGMKDLECHA